MIKRYKKTFLTIILICLMGLLRFAYTNVFPEAEMDNNRALQSSTSQSINSVIPYIKVYPNPVADQPLNVEITFSEHYPDNDFTIHMYNMIGQEVMAMRVTQGRNIIGTGGLEPGIYFLNVYKGEQSIQTLKVVKK